MVDKLTLKDRVAPFDPAMTPDQFAFWVRGIATTTGGHPMDLLDRILRAARNMK